MTKVKADVAVPTAGGNEERASPTGAPSPQPGRRRLCGHPRSGPLGPSG